jgi:hypothetical protein
MGILYCIWPLEFKLVGKVDYRGLRILDIAPGELHCFVQKKSPQSGGIKHSIGGHHSANVYERTTARAERSLTILLIFL